MKVLAVLGSPRKNGKLAVMLEAAAKAAEQAGHQVERVWIYEKRIAPCTGCMQCRETKQCVRRDDLAQLMESLRECGAVLLAAPTYFANVPGPVKNLFDRLAGAVMEEGPGGIPRGRLNPSQKYFLLTACTTTAPFDRLCGQSAGCLRAMREFFKTAGMSPMGSAILAGSKGRREVPGRMLKKLEHLWD